MNTTVNAFLTTLGLTDEQANPDVNERVVKLKMMAEANPVAYWKVVRGMVALLNALSWRLSLEDGESAAWVLHEPGEGKKEATVDGQACSASPILDDDQLAVLWVAGGGMEPDDINVTCADVWGAAEVTPEHAEVSS